MPAPSSSMRQPERPRAARRADGDVLGAAVARRVRAAPRTSTRPSSCAVPGLDVDRARDRAPRRTRTACSTSRPTCAMTQSSAMTRFAESGGCRGTASMRKRVSDERALGRGVDARESLAVRRVRAPRARSASSGTRAPGRARRAARRRGCAAPALGRRAPRRSQSTGTSRSSAEEDHPLARRAAGCRRSSASRCAATGRGSRGTRAVAMSTAPHRQPVEHGVGQSARLPDEAERGDEEQRRADEAHGEHGRIGDQRAAGVRPRRRPSRGDREPITSVQPTASDGDRRGDRGDGQ